jgi:transcriptional regulator with XRE-family HTH domain
MENEEGPRTPTETVARRMRKLRKARGLTAAQLAERMAKVGVPWKSGVVAKLEKGYREDVSVAELLALAYVLDVAPVHLLIPTEEVAYQVTPGTVVGSGQARAWVRGFAGLPDTDPRFLYAEVPAHEVAGTAPTGPGPRLDFEEGLHYWLQRAVGPGGITRPRRDGPIEWIYREPEEGEGNG